MDLVNSHNIMKLLNEGVNHPGSITLGRLEVINDVPCFLC
jgi:hypothetical protein